MRLKQLVPAISMFILLPVLALAQDWMRHDVDSEYEDAMYAWPADIDGDGAIDIVGAAGTSSENTLVWWSNDDFMGTSWTEHTIDTDPQSVYAVRATDVDADGDVDVLAAVYNMGLAWWENTAGSGMDWSMHMIDDGYASTSLEFADMNDDGSMDVLCADSDGFAWWANENGGSSWTQHTVDSGFDEPGEIYPVDMDRDGHLDILGTTNDAGYVFWWSNDDGSGTSWTRDTVAVEFYTSSGIQAADLDGDEDIDVAGTEQGFDEALLWWENIDGSGSNWNEHVLSEDLDSPGGIHIADIDADADMDILVSVELNMDWWQNVNGDATEWESYEVGGIFPAYSMTTVDMNTDGKPDVIGAANMPGDVAWFENDVELEIEESRSAATPAEFSLSNAHPNPFNPSTSMTVQLPQASNLHVSVYNALGREVAELANDRFQAGEYSLTFDANGLPSGVYFVRAHVTGRMNTVQKLVLMR